MATYTSALTGFQPHSEPFESGKLEKIEEIETYVDVGVHHCLDCGHEIFWLEDPRSPLEAEVKRLREALEAIAALGEPTWDWCESGAGHAICDQAKAIARAALEPAP